MGLKDSPMNNLGIHEIANALKLKKIDLLHGEVSSSPEAWMISTWVLLNGIKIELENGFALRELLSLNEQ